MTNTEISDNNPEKELKIDKSISDDKTKQISKKNTTQNKKITPKNDKSTKSFDEISNEIFRDLFSKKDSLVKEIKELETKKNEIEKDIESNFKGQSDNIAKRVKGFQEYLTGALQNLSQNVEKPALSETFKPDEEIIKSCFSSFTEQPDFYAEPWKLRRSLDSSDIEIMDDWFFNMGGRGSLESRGSRQKNALLSAGLISILGELYGDQFQTLILASQPERLGEWRRILQDSLGLTRDDFGPNSGIVLFERPEGVIERADRLEANEELPFIIIDAAETSVEIPILQFPLWVAFAGSDNEIYDDLELN